jgi:hypothetical protein
MTEKIKINKVVFTITNIDEENAGVKVETDPPLPDDFDNLESTPAYELGTAMWEQLQSIFEGETGMLQ